MPEQARRVTQHVLDLVGAEARRPRDVGDDAGIEVAGSGAHDHAADRREAHAGVDARAVPHGGQARTVAEVRQHDLAAAAAGPAVRRSSSQQERVRQAMKAVSADSLAA